MESRCYGCAVKFTFFKKENGCKNCGRAYCSGCLSFSAVVPRAGNSQQKVCKQCHEVLTRGSSPANASKWSPPQNYKKRVAALEAKQKPSIPQRQGLTKQDQLIAERLARLRQEKKPKSVPSQAEIEARLAALRDEPQGPIPSTQEMEARLAALQGRVPPSRTPQPVHQTPDTRTQAQQAQDLLARLTAEVAIDESWEQGGQGTSVQNDLNQGGPGGQSTDSKGQATCSLDGEKSRLLAEAAAKLQEENTRQEQILALARRLAVLQGQDPDRGRDGEAAPNPHPQAKLCRMAAWLSEVLGAPVPRGLSSSAQSQENNWNKAVVEEYVAAISGQGTLRPVRHRAFCSHSPAPQGGAGRGEVWSIWSQRLLGSGTSTETEPASGGKRTATQAGSQPHSFSPALTSVPLQVTLQDYHLPDSDDSEDEEKTIQRVLQQLTEEAALDEASGFNIPVEPTLQAQAKACRAEPEAQAMAPRLAAEEEELPWCCICNEDATLRCAGCDGDLYCVRCFREGHDAFELKEHQTSAYRPPHAGQVH